MEHLLRKSPLIIAFIFLLISFLIFKGKQEFLSNSILVEGKVEEIIDNHRPTTVYAYTTIIAFYTENNKKIYFSPSVKSNSYPLYSVGEVVKLRYNKNNPSDVEIDGFFSIWLSVIIMGGLGIIFLTIGIYINFLIA